MIRDFERATGVETKERDLQDRVVFITGAGNPNGLGAAIAKEAAVRGAKLFLTSTMNSRNEGIALQESFREQNINAVWQGANLTEELESELLVRNALDNFGRIDVLINNAGWRRDGFFVQSTDDDWLKGWQVNVMSAVHTTRSVLSQTRKNNAPTSIIFMSSLAKEGNAGQAIYATTKAALEGLAKTLAKEYRGRNIRFNVVAPGLIPGTKMTADLDEETTKKLLIMLGMERPATRDELANAVLFLASDRSLHVNGQTLFVTGKEKYL